MLTSSTQLQNRSFRVVERTRTSAKCQKMKYARAKILYFIVKYANLWRSCCCRRRGCLSSLFSLFGRYKIYPYTFVSYQILVTFTIDTLFVLWATLTDSASFDCCRKWKMKILFPRSDEITLKRPWNLLAVRSAIMTSANMRCLLRLFSRAVDLVEISGECVVIACARGLVYRLTFSRPRGSPLTSKIVWR